MITRTTMTTRTNFSVKHFLTNFARNCADYFTPEEKVNIKTSTIKKISSIRTSMLIQGRLDRMETNLMHYMWKVT